MGAWLMAHCPKRGRHYYFHLRTREVVWEIPGAWSMGRCEKYDCQYYYNQSTGESAWELPPGAQADSEVWDIIVRTVEEV